MLYITFAPVVYHESICILLAYAYHHDFTLYQMDVKSPFLNGPLKELVYFKQPPGFKDPNHPSDIYELHKALYGLKKAPHAWYDHLGVPDRVNRFHYLHEEGKRRILFVPNIC